MNEKYAYTSFIIILVIAVIGLGTMEAIPVSNTYSVTYTVDDPATLGFIKSIENKETLSLAEEKQLKSYLRPYAMDAFNEAITAKNIGGMGGDNPFGLRGYDPRIDGSSTGDGPREGNLFGGFGEGDRTSSYGGCGLRDCSVLSWDSGKISVDVGDWYDHLGDEDQQK